MRVLEPWVAGPLVDFLRESSARVALVMTASGQVIAQFVVDTLGHHRRVDWTPPEHGK